MPITGAALAVSDGNDQNFIGKLDEDDLIRKTANEKAPCPFAVWHPARGRGLNFLRGRFGFLSQINSKSGHALLVISNRRVQFHRRIGMKLNQLHPCLARSLAKTSSAGMVLTRPDKISSTRLSTSTCHACSTSVGSSA